MIVLYSFLIGCMTSPKLVMFARSRFRVLDPSSVARSFLGKDTGENGLCGERGWIYTAVLVVPLRVLVSDWLAGVTTGCAGVLVKLVLRALGRACRSSACMFNVGFVVLM